MRNKLLTVIVLMVVTGCAATPPVPISPNAPAIAIELAKAAAASPFVFVAQLKVPDQPNPGPQPGPAPPSPPGPMPPAPEWERLNKAIEDLNSNVNGLKSEVKALNTQVNVLEIVQGSKPKSGPYTGPASTSIGAIVDWSPSMDFARKKALETGNPILVHWFMEGCSPCEEMERRVFSNPQVVDLMNSQFVPFRIDIRGTSSEVRKTWNNVDSTPTDMLVASNYKGKPLTLDRTFDPVKYKAILEEGRRKKVEEAAHQEVMDLLERTREALAAKKVQPVQVSEPVYYEQYYQEPVYYGGPSYHPGYGRTYNSGNCANGRCGT